ncbi:prepilin-type N-terminal cleavage/methylation domain-containing protein [Leptospira gomenensis]|uniref:Type II secretion system protein J n=1 Tax=Leptospira gomenensis TaxID=2484974 RepID=A0A5F1YDI9_9LEPT|nr:type II secretion system protein GspJ [Leptospira gomenensis]TGK35016.1 prepilin-type N-terminal cleavage/methylation domain-containing protein [Leptospira gomenensis]TGK35306.1 prepilin-type N-terminal cleavage/methylation domain-containing protein [Leptospira gomenensis]TGK51791.1 prepilin-type N-terminal cleavage/methylation domain-containing protein [Leptospira gomenensis]TGK58386.1 prepilin-type N-terminal cleavage/methylation domain-containing protein [Leptospira gomenensis]
MRAGFTLIEISVVVMLLGVIFTGIFSTYYTSLRISRESSSPGGAAKRDILLTMENIRSTISMSFFHQTQRRLIFVGKNDGRAGERKDRLDFAATHPNSEETSMPEVREVSFYLKPMQEDPNYNVLIRREDEMVDRYPKSGGTEYVLLNYVKSFQLKYSRTGAKWEDEWDSKLTKVLPRLIRIELIVNSGKKEVRYETLAFPGILFK